MQHSTDQNEIPEVALPSYIKRSFCETVVILIKIIIGNNNLVQAYVCEDVSVYYAA